MTPLKSDATGLFYEVLTLLDKVVGVPIAAGDEVI